ncbi:transmembrane protein 44 isoform X6 [Felis catus]|uniref:transmembrane protein 44 isoform X6 n=1 Tax=Felis catus TaxID=9685 RepID=UPI001D19A26D|nr:transmembrane protein 44 isoform X6 [Felis catus]
MGEAASPAPALWDWDYLDRCFARHRVCISFGLWICASSCWIAAHALLLYLRCTKKSGRDQSALCAACCLLTSLCDTIGAILARQLTIQVFTGAYLAAVDLVNFVFILFPVCGSKLKSNLGRGSRERKRRQRLRASVFALALPLSLGPGWVLWAAVRKASGPVRGPQRRLLESLLQDNTEIFGYLLGAIAAFGSWASRIPPLSRINSDWVPLTTLPPCKSLRTMAAISRYMELTIEPVQQAGCSTSRLPGDGQMNPGDANLQEPPSYPPVQVIRARVSSSSSCEVSSINSDLEQCHRPGGRSFVEILQEDCFCLWNKVCVVCTCVEDEKRAKHRLLSLKKVRSLCVPANSVPKSLDNQDCSFPLQTLPLHQEQGHIPLDVCHF